MNNTQPKTLVACERPTEWRQIKQIDRLYSLTERPGLNRQSESQFHMSVSMNHQPTT